MISCETCDIVNGKQDGLHAPRYLIELNGGWILNHNTASNSYLGYLALATKKHHIDMSALSPEEISFLGFNFKWVNDNLKKYWLKNHPDDPIEQIYYAYFNETPFINLMKHEIPEEELSQQLHVHFHILPRTRKMRNFFNGEKLGWHLLCTRHLFPDYLIKDPQERKYLMERLKNLQATDD